MFLEEEETELFKRGKDGVLYLKYRVNSSVDTLSGVAVKHGLTKKKLKMLNSLWDDTEFYGRSYVLVPWDENKVSYFAHLLQDHSTNHS